VSVEDADNFYAFGVFPIINDIVFKLADREKAQPFKSGSFASVQRAYARCGGKSLKGVFSGLINAVGDV